jgi:hypothetical protein
VALATGKLMKLAPDKLTHAVSLALNDHIPMGQTRAQALSDWKGIADAEAGRNTIFAWRQARRIWSDSRQNVFMDIDNLTPTTHGLYDNSSRVAATRC